MTGSIGILNVGAGDTKIVFDPDDPEGSKRAAETVLDMLARGYVLMIKTGEVDAQDRPVLTRAKGFDPATHEYIVRDGPPKKKGRPSAPVKRIKASATDGVAVARTAGG